MPTGPALRVGQYLDTVIDEVKNDGRILRLSVSQSDVTAAIATDEQKWTMNNLLPGLVVKAQIQKVGFTELTGSLSRDSLSFCSKGNYCPFWLQIFHDHIAVSFLSSYTGIVDFLHLEPKKANVYQSDQLVSMQ